MAACTCCNTKGNGESRFELEVAGDADVNSVNHHLECEQCALAALQTHELGHYLLASKTHTSYGLMRSAWPLGVLIDSNRAGFGLPHMDAANTTGRDVAAIEGTSRQHVAGNNAWSL